MKEVVTERILNAYFENRATPHEKVMIKKWLQEEGSEEIFYQHLAAWEAKHLQYTPNEDKANATFRRFLDSETVDRSGQRQQRPARKLFSKTPYLRYTGIAASILIFMSFAVYFFSDQIFYDTYVTAYGMTKNILLEDGSEVTLNANSTLKVPKSLGTTQFREVWLEGEGFFSIAKKPNHVRFLVHANNVDVEVLGTKFNVNNRRGNTEVVLSEGSVRLTSDLHAKDDAVLYMKPGDMVSISQKDTIFKRKVVAPERYSAWQSNKLVFEDTPLYEVAQKIEDYYGVQIVIQDKAIADRQLTGTLPNNDLGIVLKSLSASHNLDIHREENQIIFR
ncbi:FecR domain-containing protein [Chryseolinea sp. H1M3-3]|uniref:FecR family protein n=1 Tax=Chryseolinea sp. H1M3-3 TaxID=3034144 RepID=UPI0023ED5165|nr:FecR domain-containing protein [Chryseolinea sp. H1M3-3]